MYDSKCWQLACDFLEDHPEKNTEHNREIFAQLIQTEIEEAIDELPEDNP